MERKKLTKISRYGLTISTTIGILLGFGFYYVQNNPSEDKKLSEVTTEHPSDLTNFKKPDEAATTQMKENTPSSETSSSGVNFDTYSIRNLDKTKTTSWQPFFDAYYENINNQNTEALDTFLTTNFAADLIADTNAQTMLTNLHTYEDELGIVDASYQSKIVGVVKQDDDYYVGVQEEVLSNKAVQNSNVTFYLFVENKKSTFGYTVANFQVDEELTKEVMAKEQKVE